MINVIRSEGRQEKERNMSNKSNIQYCDSTINPVMGCDGCELYPPPGVVRNRFAASLKEKYIHLDEESLKFHLKRSFGDKSTTQIWHSRRQIMESLVNFFGLPADQGVEDLRLLEKEIKCYAAHLNFRHGKDHTKPDKITNKGYAPTFEEVTLFPGRMVDSAALSDLTECSRLGAPWNEGLPRIIFISDMGDALSNGVDFAYLKNEIIDEVRSKAGARHIWLWLTKRPERMAEFSDWLIEKFGAGIWPDNLVAMTSVTSQDTAYRLNHLRRVACRFRGVSVEPLFGPVELNLGGISWVVCGGESDKHRADPFEIDWARSLHSQCVKAGIPFFMKQLGSRPYQAGIPLILSDGHGGDWHEWPEYLRVRDYPQAWYPQGQKTQKRNN